MSAAADEDVDVHLPRKGGEHLAVAHGHDLLPVDDAYAHGLVGDGEGEWEVVVLVSAEDWRPVQLDVQEGSATVNEDTDAAYVASPVTSSPSLRCLQRLHSHRQTRRARRAARARWCGDSRASPCRSHCPYTRSAGSCRVPAVSEPVLWGRR